MGQCANGLSVTPGGVLSTSKTVTAWFQRRPSEARVYENVLKRAKLCGRLMLSIVALFPPRLAAQTPASSAPDPIVHVAAGYEVHRDRFRYVFENPSSVSTSFLVPHRFAQTYVADNRWFVASARYPLAGGRMQTEFGVTPETQTHASDLDTFFNPGDDVVVSGTDGPVAMRGLRLAQWTEGRLWPFDLRLGYVYRRDSTRFLPTDRIVTHSNPASISRTPIGGNETTVSETHEFAIGLSRPAALSSRWRLTGGADVFPVLLARLTTRLPKKYPGQDIVFLAKGWGVNAHVELLRTPHHWPVALTLTYGHAWSYMRANQFTRDALEIAARVGVTP
jgi:hypothetical protein